MIHYKKFLFLIFAFSLAFYNTDTTASTKPRCFQQTEKDVVTTLVLHTAPSTPENIYTSTLMVHEESNGKPIAEPFPIKGRMEGEKKFIMADGSVFKLEPYLHLVHPSKGAPMSGLIFQPVECARKRFILIR